MTAEYYRHYIRGTAGAKDAFRGLLRRFRLKDDTYAAGYAMLAFLAIDSSPDNVYANLPEFERIVSESTTKFVAKRRGDDLLEQTDYQRDLVRRVMRYLVRKAHLDHLDPVGELHPEANTQLRITVRIFSALAKSTDDLSEQYPLEVYIMALDYLKVRAGTAEYPKVLEVPDRWDVPRDDAELRHYYERAITTLQLMWPQVPAPKADPMDDGFERFAPMNELAAELLLAPELRVARSVPEVAESIKLREAAAKAQREAEARPKAKSRSRRRKPLVPRRASSSDDDGDF